LAFFATQLHDVPTVLARLRLCQARPQAITFKQLSDSISQLLLLRQMVEALAPAAAAGWMAQEQLLVRCTETDGTQ
jgi:hypothetical protein